MERLAGKGVANEAEVRLFLDNRACALCLHWNRSPEGTGEGTCRRHSPAPGFVKGQVRQDACWPVTMDYWWCAEWTTTAERLQKAREELNARLRQKKAK